MKKFIIFIAAMLFVVNSSMAIKVQFTAANMSVNSWDGTTGIFTSFKIFPDNFNNPDSLELIDFPHINYKDVEKIIIEKANLTMRSNVSFAQIASYSVTQEVAKGHVQVDNIVQGNTYVFRLLVASKSGKQYKLLNVNTTTRGADAKLRCAKLNTVYRKSCHNCFQERIVDPSDGGFYRALSFSRVLELDVWPSYIPGTANWVVRHTQGHFNNKNNCGCNTSGDKSFIVCLNDVIKWHNDHPNHGVIILHIDLKGKWNEFHNNQTPTNLDELLLSLIPNADVIYKPRDLSGKLTNMRLAAHYDNWPSMGDLVGKFIFVLTGDGSLISDYIAERNRGVAVAFCAANVKRPYDIYDLSGGTPNISSWARNDIVFYNLQQFNKSLFGGQDADLNTSILSSGFGYINRSYGIGFVWQPGKYNKSEYTKAIDFSVNNIAVANIQKTFYPTNSKPENGLHYEPGAINAYIDNSHIYSTHKSVTQAATQTITAKNLIVEPNTHYRMIAGKSITLKPGTKFSKGSSVVVKIDDCKCANYNSDKVAASEQLSQQTIENIMKVLDEELYKPDMDKANNDIRLRLYPNPANNIINIQTGNVSSQVTANIYNAQGQLMTHVNLRGYSYQLDISTYPKGIYMVCARDKTHSTTSKFIKD